MFTAYDELHTYSIYFNEEKITNKFICCQVVIVILCFWILYDFWMPAIVLWRKIIWWNFDPAKKFYNSITSAHWKASFFSWLPSLVSVTEIRELRQEHQFFYARVQRTNIEYLQRQILKNCFQKSQLCPKETVENQFERLSNIKLL